MYRSTKGASKARRDQINTEIRNLRELLPISDADKARLSYLHIMSLACMYTRKSVFFTHETKLAGHEGSRRENLLSLSELTELMNSLPGFLLLISSEGKLLYMSDTVAEHLGHSMVDLVAQSDSVYDIIEPNDHFVLRSNLVPTTVTDTDRLFRCRFSTSKFIRRQSAESKLMLVRARCLSLTTSISSYWSSNPVWMCSCSPLDPRTPYPSSPKNPLGLLTPPPDQSFFLACFQTRHARDMTVLEANDSVSVYLGYDLEALRSRSWYSLLHPRDLSHASAKHCSLLCETGKRQAEMVIQVEALDGTWVWLYMVLQLEAGDYPISSLNYVISESEAWSVRQQLCLEQNQLSLYLGGAVEDSGLSGGPEALGLLGQSDPTMLSSPEQVFTPSSSGLSAQSFDFSLPTSGQSSSDELGSAGPLDTNQSQQHQHHTLSQLHQLLQNPVDDPNALGQWQSHPAPLQPNPMSTNVLSSNPYVPPFLPPPAPSMPAPQSQKRAEYVCTPPYTPRLAGISNFSFSDEQSAHFNPSVSTVVRANTQPGAKASTPTPTSCVPPQDVPSTQGLALVPGAAHPKPHLQKRPLDMVVSGEHGTSPLPEICGPLFVDVPHGNFPAGLPEGLLTPEASPTMQSLTPGQTFNFPIAPSCDGWREEIEQIEISLLAQYISAVAEGFYDNPVHPKLPTSTPKTPACHHTAPPQVFHNEPLPTTTNGVASEVQVDEEGLSLFKENLILDVSPTNTHSPSPVSSSSHTINSRPSTPNTLSSCSTQCSPPTPETWSSPCQSQGAQSPIGEYHLSSVQSMQCIRPVVGGLQMCPGLSLDERAFSGMDEDVEMEVVEEATLAMRSQSSSIPASPLLALPLPTSVTVPTGPAPGPSCAQSLLEELVAMETVFGATAPMPPLARQQTELYQLPPRASPHGIFPDGTSDHTF